MTMSSFTMLLQCNCKSSTQQHDVYNKLLQFLIWLDPDGLATDVLNTNEYHVFRKNKYVGTA